MYSAICAKSGFLLFVQQRRVEGRVLLGGVAGRAREENADAADLANFRGCSCRAARRRASVAIPRACAVGKMPGDLPVRLRRDQVAAGRDVLRRNVEPRARDRADAVAVGALDVEQVDLRREHDARRKVPLDPHRRDESRSVERRVTVRVGDVRVRLHLALGDRRLTDLLDRPRRERRLVVAEVAPVRASDTAPSMAKTRFVVLPVICGETPLSTRTPRIVPLRSTTAMMALFTSAAAAARSSSALTSCVVNNWDGSGGADGSTGLVGSYPCTPGAISEPLVISWRLAAESATCAARAVPETADCRAAPLKTTRSSRPISRGMRARSGRARGQVIRDPHRPIVFGRLHRASSSPAEGTHAGSRGHGFLGKRAWAVHRRQHCSSTVFGRFNDVFPRISM